ncbi:MAG: hypothetical protein ACI82A_001961 [Candidatus Azotimanducaceae bacterium]|jgi:hypothetical protein
MRNIRWTESGHVDLLVMMGGASPPANVRQADMSGCRWAGDIAAQALELLALIGLTGNTRQA